jgi:hypothetical protein
VFRALAETTADRVEYDVTACVEEVVLTLDRRGPETVAEEMPPASVAAVEGLGVQTVQAVEAGGEARAARLEYDVVVVRHQAERVTVPGEAMSDVCEEAKKAAAVEVVDHDRGAVDTASGHVEVAVSQLVSW